MIKFKTILFPTDFSRSAEHALDYAISLAIEYESSILLAHVIEDISFNSPFTLSSFPTSLEYHHGMEEKVKEKLAAVISAQLKRQIQLAASFDARQMERRLRSVGADSGAGKRWSPCAATTEARKLLTRLHAEEFSKPSCCGTRRWQARRKHRHPDLAHRTPSRMNTQVTRAWSFGAVAPRTHGG